MLLKDIESWVEELGGERLDMGRYLPVLDEPALNAPLITAMYAIHDVEMLRERMDTPDYSGQILEFETEESMLAARQLSPDLGWYQQEYNEYCDGERVYVILQRDAGDPRRLGGFLVTHVGASWLVKEIESMTGMRMLISPGEC
ncbi:MAG: hypothetical protein ABF747_07705 [Bifidobacterium sp.]|uniref:Uncharacterized protein n=1 Tax=Bifidobacterium fermentum TaxID=3059035 RepID=A0AB39UIM2_9BIFI